MKNELGRHAAVTDFDQTIWLNLDSAEAYYNLGVAKENLGSINEAREDYRRALALAQKSGNENLIAGARHTSVVSRTRAVATASSKSGLPVAASRSWPCGSAIGDVTYPPEWFIIRRMAKQLL